MDPSSKYIGAESGVQLTRKDSTYGIINFKRKAYRARIRFKAIVRLAYANRAWLAADEQVHRKKHHCCYQTLRITIADKAILCKNTIHRTEEDKERIYKIISFIKSFRKYPEYTVRQLASVTYFVYYDANRIVVRQDHIPKAMYFLLKGECVSYSTKYDTLLKEVVEASRVVIRPGYAFGDYALLHHIPRISTIETLTPCEFLYLKADDFDVILRDLIARDWQSLTDYMNKLTYFKEWDFVTKRQCCIVAKRVHFKRNQTILEDTVKKTNLPMVHFIISGNCSVIEFLMVHENTVNGEIKQRLFSTKEEDELKSMPITRSSTGRILSTAELKRQSALQSDMERLQSLTALTKRVEGYNEAFVSGEEEGEEDEEEESDDDSDDDEGGEEKRNEQKKLWELEARIKHYNWIQLEKEKKHAKAHKNMRIEIDYPADVKTYFVQVCKYSENACFNIGENFRRRCIVANTDVECLLIPHYWLMGQGFTKYWSMIKSYLNREIPTTEQIFKQFQLQRKFKKYKTDFVSDVQHKTYCNSVTNVPYSIRMQQDFEYSSVNLV